MTLTSSHSTRPKDKGHRSDCNTHRGISLLSITGKAFARAVLNRLQKLAKRVYPEAQCGFKAGRSTIDVIFSLRQLKEKCREQRKPLYIAFIDLSKAFEPNQLEGVIHSLAEDRMPSQAPKDDNGSTSDPFPIKSGVKQGRVLPPTFLDIFFSVLLSYAFSRSEDGVYQKRWKPLQPCTSLSKD